MKHTREQPLLLVVHNLEHMPPFHQKQLSELVKEPQIYLAASVLGLIWSS